MAVTPEDIGRMTIEELEQAASRVAAALAVLREVGALKLSGPVAPEAAPEAAPPQRPPTSGPVVRFSPSELADRERLLRANRPELPEDIAALERQ